MTKHPAAPPTRVVLVVNPASDRGRAATTPVPAALRAAGVDVAREVRTTRLDDVDDAVRAAAGAPVVVVGGDGTVARALAVAAGCDAVVAPMPGGRGNDLCGALGIRGDATHLAARLGDAVERRVDLCATPAGAFVNVASIGYDAEVSRVARHGRLPGAWSYVLAGVRALVTTRPLDLRVVVDGDAREHRAWLCSVSGSGRFGGGIRACPTSRLDDGLVEVVVVDAVPRPLLVVTVLALVLGGRHVHLPWVRVRAGSQVHVEGRGQVWADGEPLTALPLDVVVRPGAARVLAPRRATRRE